MKRGNVPQQSLLGFVLSPNWEEQTLLDMTGDTESKVALGRNTTMISFYVAQNCKIKFSKATAATVEDVIGANTPPLIVGGFPYRYEQVPDFGELEKDEYIYLHVMPVTNDADFLYVEH